MLGTFTGLEFETLLLLSVPLSVGENNVIFAMLSGNTHFFYKQHFYKQHQAEIAKKISKS